MKKQAGFTLIELIMVIVILGILSAFALPRFADLSSNAETAAIEGALGSIKSASAIVRSSALVNGQTGGTGEIELEDLAVALVEGYAKAGGAGDVDGTSTNGIGIVQAAGISDSDFAVIYNDGTAATFDEALTTAAQKVAANGVLITIEPATTDKPCFTYTQANSTNVASISEMGTLGGTAAARTCTP